MLYYQTAHPEKEFIDFVSSCFDLTRYVSVTFLEIKHFKMNFILKYSNGGDIPLIFHLASPNVVDIL